jgi:restriction endonuclease Mrr
VRWRAPWRIGSNSRDDRAERLPSGQGSVFRNRRGWARTYFKKAALLESPKRAVYKITARGRQTLAGNPTRCEAPRAVAGTADAIDYAARIDTKVVLIDGKQLAALMIDSNVGVSDAATYTIKRVDSDYFEES